MFDQRGDVSEMSDLMNGFAFLRGMSWKKRPKEMKGYKRIMIGAVIIVPNDVLAKDHTYRVRVQPDYFGEDTLVLALTQPKQVMPNNGYRIDQVLVSTEWIPGLEYKVEIE